MEKTLNPSHNLSKLLYIQAFHAMRDAKNPSLISPISLNKRFPPVENNKSLPGGRDFVILVFFEIPLGIITVEVVLGEGGGRVACRIETELLVDTLLTWYGLWHDAVSAIGELLDTPELLIGTCIGRNSGYLLVGCSSECTLCTLDGDLEVRVT